MTKTTREEVRNKAFTRIKEELDKEQISPANLEPLIEIIKATTK